MTLDDYLRENKITETAFAAVIGINQSSVHRLRKGTIRPDIETLARIVSATGGAVTLSDFIDTETLPPFPAPGGAADPDAGEAA
jgi:putative transcriptional regulator